MKDEVWQPGYSGPPPVSGATSFGRFLSVNEVESDGRSRSNWAPIACVVVVVTLIAGAIVVGSLTNASSPQGVVEPAPSIRVVDDGRPQFSASESDEPTVALAGLGRPFAGADAPSLPDSVALRWTTELTPLVADGGNHATTWAQAVGDRHVIAGTGNARTVDGPAVLHLLDASTGDRVWARSFELRLDRVRVIDVFDDMLIITVDSEVLALDIQTGEESWTTRLEKIEGGMQRIERLQGTDLLGLFTSGPDEESVTVVDPATGSVVSEMVGRIVGTDLSGRWFAVRGTKLFEFDLGAQGAPTSPESAQPTVIELDQFGGVDLTTDRPVVVAGDTLVTTVDGRLATGSLSAHSDQPSDSGGLTPLSTVVDVPDGLIVVSRFVSLGSASFAIVGGGMVTGAEVLDDTLRFGWQRSGRVSASYETAAGVVLVVATDGGAAQTLVNGATGETIASLTMSPGLFDSLEVAGNGVVARRVSSDGVQLVGLDLAGTERWALDGSTPVSLGDGIVVRSTPQSDGSFIVSAYGDVG